MVASNPRKAKSKAWWKEHNKDPYVLEARKSGLRSRASFKLIEIQERFQLVQPEDVVLDLGCTPGGWSTLLVDMVGEDGMVVGIDRLVMQPIPGVQQIVNDITAVEIPSQVQELVGNNPINGIFSDIAPDTTGHKKVDRLRMEQAIEDIWFTIKDLLASGGYFVIKIRDGALESAIKQQMKQQTLSLRVFKPEASRNSSSETYLIGTDFRKS